MRRRVANRAAHQAARRDAARTPAQHVAAAWDHWRVLAAELDQLDADRAAAYYEAITAALDAQIVQLTQILLPPEKR
ncbi:hypothetical protein ACIBF1_44195 [Spirillospora sp. NPDC050679]